MRKLTVLLAAGLVLGLSGQAMAAATDASATADVGAKVLIPIGISKTADLNFGSFAVHASTAGTVVVTAGGVRSVTAGVGLLGGNADPVTAASFDVTGEASATYTISLPTTVTVTKSGGGATMTVNTFTSSPSATGTLNASGQQTVGVGATLNVAGGQTAGVYSIANGLSVTVAYN